MKIFLETQNANTDIDCITTWVIQHGVILIKITFLKLHDMCHNPKCNCQKQSTFCPKQFQLKSSGFKNTMKNTFKGSQTAWNKLLKLALTISSPYTGMAVSDKTKKWIEYHYTPEMNSLSIDIDHVQPICMFDVSKD